MPMQVWRVARCRRYHSMALSNPKQVGISFATRRSPSSLRAHDLDAQQHTNENINLYRQALSLWEMEASAGPHDR